jgi:anti-sigma-K factor RskA
MSDDARTPQHDEGHSDLLEMARSLTVADFHLDTPPPGLWAGIEALVAAGEPAGATAEPDRPAPQAEAPAPVEHRAPVVPLTARPARRLPFFLGAAAAILAAAVGLFAYLQRDDAPGATRVDEVALSTAGLEPLGSTSEGRATLLQLADGEYALDVQVDNLPRVNGFLELWIIDTEVKGMYSLGPISRSGRYTLPENVDPTRFPIVDVSVEPADGQPTHSGKSILRGKLTI